MYDCSYRVYYLRQGGYVIVIVGLSVSLSVSNFAHKLLNGFCMKFSGKVGNGPMNKWLNFGGDPNNESGYGSKSKTCIGGGMHYLSSSSYCWYRRIISVWWWRWYDDTTPLRYTVNLNSKPKIVTNECNSACAWNQVLRVPAFLLTASSGRQFQITLWVFSEKINISLPLSEN